MERLDVVATWLKGLHQRVVDAMESVDGGAKFRADAWEKRGEAGGLLGSGDSRILEGGAVLERAGAGFSDVRGQKLPPTASERHPHLAGQPFRATGVSVVIHPRNPYAPTAHMNVRAFATESGEWWFGGGFDLTPYYLFAEDAQAWHRAAKAACAPAGEGVYEDLKRRCDEYFFLVHRNEARGVGGLFFDDLSPRTPRIGGTFEQCFAFIQRVGDAFVEAYPPIVRKRASMPHGAREREWQTIRRGRYVEFNLVWDRGTLFGLQSRGRTESILMSMPPEVSWRYEHVPAPGTPEAELLEVVKTPRAWV